MNKDVQRRGDVGAELLYARRVLEEDLRGDGHQVSAAEEATAGQALGEDAAQGENADGGRVLGLAAGLLGGDEARGPDEGARESQSLFGDARARHPEVDDLDAFDLP